MSEDALRRICVITQPLPNREGSNVLVCDLIRVLEPLSDELFVITGNFPENSISNERIHIRNIRSDDKIQSMLIRIPKYIFTQLRVSSELIRLFNKIDIVIFYIGAKMFIVAHLAAKLLRKKTVVIVTGSALDAERIYGETLLGMGGIVFSQITVALEKVAYKLADQIIAEFRNVIYQFGLIRYENKIALSGSFFDTSLFELKRNFSDRRNVVGYIGRLSEEKGVTNFVRAIPLILNRRDDTEFLIGGDGRLWGKIQDELRGGTLSEKVQLAGWIPHGQLIHYYNDLKILVVPSYFESIPIVALEAMACGTPVLATPVGSVPDVIRDEENGFILKDNSPQCIADAVVKVLEHPRLDEIAGAARASVESGFTYQAATEQYRTILNNLVK